MRSFVGQSSIRELCPPAFHELTVDLILPVCFTHLKHRIQPNEFGTPGIWVSMTKSTKQTGVDGFNLAELLNIVHHVPSSDGFASSMDEHSQPIAFI